MSHAAISVGQRILMAHLCLDNGKKAEGLALLTDPPIDPATLSLPDQIAYHYWLTVAYLVTDAPHEAIAPAWEGIRLATEAGDAEMLVRLRNELGIVYFVLERYKESIELHRACLPYLAKIEQQEQQPDANLVYGVYRSLGGACVELGEIDSGIYFLDEAWKVSQDIADRLKAARVKWNLSWAWFKKGDHRQAVKHGFEGIALLREAGRDAMAGRLLSQVCLSFVALGEYEAAYTSLATSLRIAQEQADNEGIMISYSNLAELQKAEKKYAEAQESFGAALAVPDAETYVFIHGQVMRDLTDLYQRLGMSDEAVTAFAAARKSLHAVQARVEIRSTYLNHAQFWQRQGDTDRAVSILMEGVQTGCLD